MHAGGFEHSPEAQPARVKPLSQAPAGSRPRGRKTIHECQPSYCSRMIWSGRWPVAERRGNRGAERSGAAGGRRHARKTAKAPVLMAEAWSRTPSIGRTGMLRPVCEAARSAAAGSPCLGSGKATKILVQPCIGGLSVAAGTARARWVWQLATVCWAEVLPTTTSEADRGLGPMPPSSARELWPFCVLRDSCHAALPDPPGLPPIGSGRRTGGSRHHPYPLRDLRMMDTAWMQRVLGHAACVSVKSQVSGSNVSPPDLTQNAPVSSCSCLGLTCAKIGWRSCSSSRLRRQPQLH